MSMKLCRSFAKAAAAAAAAASTAVFAAAPAVQPPSDFAMQRLNALQQKAQDAPQDVFLEVRKPKDRLDRMYSGMRRIAPPGGDPATLRSTDNRPKAKAAAAAKEAAEKARDQDEARAQFFAAGKQALGPVAAHMEAAFAAQPMNITVVPKQTYDDADGQMVLAQQDPENNRGQFITALKRNNDICLHAVAADANGNPVGYIAYTYARVKGAGAPEGGMDVPMIAALAVVEGVDPNHVVAELVKDTTQLLRACFFPYVITHSDNGPFWKTLGFAASTRNGVRVEDASLAKKEGQPLLCQLLTPRDDSSGSLTISAVPSSYKLLSAELLGREDHGAAVYPRSEAAGANLKARIKGLMEGGTKNVDPLQFLERLEEAEATLKGSAQRRMRPSTEQPLHESVRAVYSLRRQRPVAPLATAFLVRNLKRV